MVSEVPHEEVCLIVYQAFRYVREIIDVVVSRTLNGIPAKELAKGLFGDMRATLSSPCMFTVMRILRRLQKLLAKAALHFHEGDLYYDDPPVRNTSVDVSLLTIYRRVIALCTEQSNTNLRASLQSYNPYDEVSESLDFLVSYTAEKQFGVEV